MDAGAVLRLVALRAGGAVQWRRDALHQPGARLREPRRGDPARDRWPAPDQLQPLHPPARGRLRRRFRHLPHAGHRTDPGQRAPAGTHPPGKRPARTVPQRPHRGGDSRLRPARGQALIGRLREHLAHPELSYSHAWSVGDIVWWDNQAVLHARNAFPASERRRLKRISLAGSRPF
ncbi:TauD/TfdA family dioxygenase [Pseudomonas aeruginosa]|nr:TauD/TfdA family dioxygenase [Pseudomonas aeruginosa]MDO1590378.1 TauD/TfdA family dioxygenase [Pseudomonas aeruginosa]